MSVGSRYWRANWKQRKTELWCRRHCSSTATRPSSRRRRLSHSRVSILTTMTATPSTPTIVTVTLWCWRHDPSLRQLPSVTDSSTPQIQLHRYLVNPIKSRVTSSGTTNSTVMCSITDPLVTRYWHWQILPFRTRCPLLNISPSSGLVTWLTCTVCRKKPCQLWLAITSMWINWCLIIFGSRYAQIVKYWFISCAVSHLAIL